MPHHLGIRNTVQEADPGHQELSDKLVFGVHPLPQDGDKCGHLELLTLRHNVLEEPVEELGAVLDILVRIRDHDGDGGEDVGEHGEDDVSGHLDHVV